jgi:hypothetical protein
LEKVVDEALELSLKFYSFFKKHEIGKDVIIISQVKSLREQT